MLFSNDDETRSARVWRTEKVGNGFLPEFELFRKDRKETGWTDKKEENVNQYEVNMT